MATDALTQYLMETGRDENLPSFPDPDVAGGVYDAHRNRFGSMSFDELVNKNRSPFMSGVRQFTKGPLATVKDPTATSVAANLAQLGLLGTTAGLGLGLGRAAVGHAISADDQRRHRELMRRQGVPVSGGYNAPRLNPLTQSPLNTVPDYGHPWFPHRVPGGWTTNVSPAPTERLASLGPYGAYDPSGMLPQLGSLPTYGHQIQALVPTPSPGVPGGFEQNPAQISTTFNDPTQMMPQLGSLPPDITPAPNPQLGSSPPAYDPTQMTPQLGSLPTYGHQIQALVPTPSPGVPGGFEPNADTGADYGEDPFGGTTDDRYGPGGAF